MKDINKTQVSENNKKEWSIPQIVVLGNDQTNKTPTATESPTASFTLVS